MTNKKDLSELDICRIYILPALIKAGWNPKTQIREQVYFTDGKIHVRGNITKRGKRKRADYILYYKPNDVSHNDQNKNEYCSNRYFIHVDFLFYDFNLIF